MTLAIVTPDRHPTPTQAQLDELLADWQRRLRLRDWNVKVQLRRRHDMSLEDSCGACRWQLSKKLACVELLDPIDYDPGSFGWPQDVEWTLVHELLHLHFAPFAEFGDGPLNTAQEQAIDLIAGALVDAKRGGDDP